MFQIIGTVSKIGELQTINDKFYKKDIVVIYVKNEKTPFEKNVPIKFELLNKMVDMMDVYKEGDVIKIHFDLDGREWVNEQQKTVVFNSLKPYKIERLNSQGNNAENSAYHQEPKPTKYSEFTEPKKSETAPALPNVGSKAYEIQPDVKDEDLDDLPF